MQVNRNNNQSCFPCCCIRDTTKNRVLIIALTILASAAIGTMTGVGLRLLNGMPLNTTYIIGGSIAGGLAATILLSCCIASTCYRVNQSRSRTRNVPLKPISKTTKGKMSKDDLHKRIEDKIATVNALVSKIDIIDIQKDLRNYINFLSSNLMEIINQVEQEQDLILLWENADDIFSTMMFEIESLLKEQTAHADDDYQLSTKPSQDAIAWQDKLLSAMLKSDSKELQRYAEEGSKLGFLNLKFHRFFGGTVVHTLSKGLCRVPCLVKVLEAKPDLSSQDYWGNTPLMWAIANASNSHAMAILKYIGPHLDVQCKLHKNTALHLAVGKGYRNINANGQILEHSNIEIVNAWLKGSCNVNLRNKDGNTPLHLACLRRDVEMIKALLQASADVNQRNNQGKTPEDLLGVGYKAACSALEHTVSVYLLEKETYEKSLSEARYLFTPKST